MTLSKHPNFCRSHEYITYIPGCQLEGSWYGRARIKKIRDIKICHSPYPRSFWSKEASIWSHWNPNEVWRAMENHGDKHIFMRKTMMIYIYNMFQNMVMSFNFTLRRHVWLPESMTCDNLGIWPRSCCFLTWQRNKVWTSPEVRWYFNVSQWVRPNPKHPRLCVVNMGWCEKAVEQPVGSES